MQSLRKTGARKVLISGLVIFSTSLFIHSHYNNIPDTDKQTLSKIQELQSNIYRDCRKMSITDFHLENTPQYLREQAYRLAENCMTGK